MLRAVLLKIQLWLLGSGVRLGKTACSTPFFYLPLMQITEELTITV